MDNQPGSYREIEHTADLGIEVTAPDLPTLFASAGEELYNLIAYPATDQSEDGIPVSANGRGTEKLHHE